MCLVVYNGGNRRIQMQKSQKLEKRVSFRMTEKENQQLKGISKLLGCKPSDTLRLAMASMNIAAEELKATA